MNKFEKIIKVSELVPLFILACIFVAAIADMEFAAWIKILIVAGLLVSLLYAGYGVAQLAGVIMSKDDNKNVKLSVVKMLSVSALNILVTSCSFMLNHFPGGSVMLIGGSLLAIIFVILLLVFKESKFPGLKLVPRILIAMALSILVRTNWNLLTSYHANESIIDSLCNSYKMKEPLSVHDATIVAAWHDINQGISKDKALKVYDLSEDEYDAKADALAYGGADKIPQNRNVEIVSLNNGYYDVDMMVSPNDTAYVHSLRPIYYELISDSRLRNAVDFYNVAKHTDNVQFKEFVKEEYKQELKVLKEMPFGTMY